MLVLEWSRVGRRTVNNLWWVMSLALLAVITEILALSGPNICIVKQKYNITKRVKYRAPMSVRTYEWCLAVPPRCSRYTTEIRDLTRLETEERTAEVAVCCPGYKMKNDFTCAPICPFGKTGTGCAADCPPNKWGPNCVHDCKKCSDHAKCSLVTGECICHTGWQGESCETSISTTTSTTTVRASLLTTSIAELTTSPAETSLPPITPARTQTTITTSQATISQAATEDLRRQNSKAINAEISSAISKVKLGEKSTKDLKYIRTEHSSTRTPNENTTTTLSDRIYGENTTNLVTKKLSTNKVKAGTDYDDASNATNSKETNSTTEITEIIDKISKSTIFNNSTITPWTFTVTKTLKTVPTSMTTIATTELHTTESVILSTTKEFPRKILPFTKLETTTKSTSKETETTKKPEPTKTIATTAKFRPKEIWIKPAQKGEIPLIDSKIKTHEVSLFKPRHSTVKELPATTTTPRTIIVSIIPTSKSYSTFKKISLTTASAPHTQQYKTSRLMDLYRITVPNKNEVTATPFLTIIQNFTAPKKHYITTTTAMPTTKSSTLHGSKAPTMLTKKYLYSEATNSMSMTNEVNIPNYPPSVPNITSTRKEITATSISGTVTTVPFPRVKSMSLSTSTVKIDVTSTLSVTATSKSEWNKTANIADKEKNIIGSTGHSLKRNATLSKEKTVISTEGLKKLTTLSVTENTSSNKVTNREIQQDEEETFHILTEPEHITAVAGDRPSEISTVDLIYVLTIVGGMVMGIITIAVVIVMFERCKRQRYGDIMKMNNIRMQVVIDNNDRPPPPYVRSIFHTPLPDPPMSEKCHYQPISTLDRNLKQFMRPVVVQAISPLMLENFRGILECHYDHLPIRNHDFRASECGRTCCSATPSVDVCVEPQSLRVNSVTESTIETLKCEADVYEIEGSEPLYAEIPCWRPPSAHAVEIVNVNGEAITEL